jgi:hypothetical protein
MSLKKDPTITVKQFRSTNTQFAYRVLTTTNTTIPKIGDVLTEPEARDYINRGYRVTVRAEG